MIVTLLLLTSQAVPALGTVAPPGAAGVWAVTLRPGAVSPNPAGLALRRGTRLDLTTAVAADISADEVRAGVRWRPGAIGFGVRVSTRRVRDLFEDPVLAASGLRVGDTELELGAAVPLAGGVALGLVVHWTGSTVLGSHGVGWGGRLGASWRRGWFALGATWGTAVAAMRWHDAGGVAFTRDGRQRVAIGGVVAPAWRRVQPAVAIEWSGESGADAATMLCVAGSVGLFRRHVWLAGGVAVPTRAETRPAYHEIGAGVRIGSAEVHGGLRLGARPIPGSTLFVGLALGAP